MSYFYHTNVPNLFFDQLLPRLGYAELKVFLVIVRQTYGWVDKRTGRAKERDWISRQFFVKKTGLSKRAVSRAVSQLISKHLIVVTSHSGRVLHLEHHRSKEQKLYYATTLSRYPISRKR